MFRFSGKKALGQGLKCRVQHLVPGEEIEVAYSATSTGQELLNEVAQQLDLLDKDYLGLKLIDDHTAAAAAAGSSSLSGQWLDLCKPVVKQTKGLLAAGQSLALSLRFKYYPAEPALLANESTRYFLYLQLRADLLEGRLRSESPDTLAYLVACVLQSELGDASSPEHARRNATQDQHQQENYVAEYKFVPNQSDDLELAAIRLHQSEDFYGLRPGDAELNFLKKACQLDTYGVDPHPVKDDSSRNHFLIGVNHRGILTFQDSRLTNLFGWPEIERIELDGKLVLVYCHKIERKVNPGPGDKQQHQQETSTTLSKRRSMFACRCPTQELARNFWRLATEHKYFFTLEATPERPIVTNTGGFLRKSHKLKYAGRVEKDLLRDHVDETRASGVKRSRSLMIKTNAGGPLWQGFKNQHQLGNSSTDTLHHQTSMNHLYSSDQINKTIPASMNYFREDDEEQEEGAGAGAGARRKDSQRGRPSQGSLVTGGENSSSGQAAGHSQPFSRKPQLTTKSEAATSAIRRGSQVYMDTQQHDHDFLRASLILVLILAAIFITILLVSEADRPHSVSLLVKKLSLERVAATMRNSYYLPLKSALRTSVGQLFALLDSKLL